MNCFLLAILVFGALTLPSDVFSIGILHKEPTHLLKAFPELFRFRRSDGSRPSRSCRGQQLDCFSPYYEEIQGVMTDYINGSPFNTGEQKQEEVCGPDGIVSSARQCAENVGVCPGGPGMTFVDLEVNYICSAEGRAAMSAMDGHSCNKTIDADAIADSCILRQVTSTGISNPEYCVLQGWRIQCSHESLVQECSPQVADFISGYFRSQTSWYCPNLL